MRLSLSWLYDHLSTQRGIINYSHLVQKFNSTTAEIAQEEHITLHPADFTLARLVKITPTSCRLSSAELGKELELSIEDERQEGMLYLLYKGAKGWRWAGYKDIGGIREGMLPALSVPEAHESGGWKKEVEWQDTIWLIDNIALTHRPDLWGHRGIAREISVAFNIPLIEETDLLAHTPLQLNEKAIEPSAQFPYALGIKHPGCRRAAAAYIPQINQRASSPWMAFRLARVDCRIINAVVDGTNYVMFDIGHPMHAFDAERFAGKSLLFQEGIEAELALLDGTTAHVRTSDIVVTNGQKAVAVAGIMGGASSAVTATTNSLLLEAGAFDAHTIRTTAARLKIRTEASTRFEKSLDPHAVSIALARFIKLMQQERIIPQEFAGPVVVVGRALAIHTIVLSHARIEEKIGIQLSSETIESILQGLGCMVTQQHTPELHYTIAIPTFRAVKDLLLPEDCIEEIARFVGFDVLQPHLPEIVLQPTPLQAVNRVRLVKTLCASLLNAHEVRNYPVYDDTFLHTLSWQPEDTVRLKNPMASHQAQLVTSLVPNLLKNCVELAHEADTFALFEWNRIWHKDMSYPTHVREERSLSFVLIDGNKKADFYMLKNDITELFRRLNLPISFEKAVRPAAWYHPYKTAVIKSAGTVVGFFGFMHPSFLQTVACGTGFIMEINGDWLLAAQEIPLTFKPFSKYQASHRDISCLMPYQHTVHEIEEKVKTLSERITLIELVDFFSKPEWKTERSLTFRLTIQDQHKTLLKEEIDEIMAKVTQQLQRMGATIR